jgi:hypothetical protein
MDDVTYKYNCEKCNYHTNIKQLIKKHEETILHKTGERGKKKKTINKYKCDKCEYKTYNNKNYLLHKLNNHSTKEERIKEFKHYCDKCDFGCFTINSFTKHENSQGHKRRNLQNRAI